MGVSVGRDRTSTSTYVPSLSAPEDMTYEPQKLLGCQTSPRTREARRPSWGETAPGQGGEGGSI